MPELPEVETLRLLLDRRLAGATFLSARFNRPDILRDISPDAFRAAVAGRTLDIVQRRGKYLCLLLRGENRAALSLVVHLRMRGRLAVEAAEATPAPYFCAALADTQGRELRFYDMWRWGEWRLVAPDAMPRLPGLGTLGPEPLEEAFSADCLQAQLAFRRTPIKPLLLTQRVVAGLGNIYCDESLHRARLHPARPANSLDVQETQRLHGAIVEIVGKAVQQGHSYAETLVAQQANLEDFAGVYIPRVYDRPGHRCPTCQTPLVKISFHGRGTTFCPDCQPGVAAPKKSRL